MKKAINKTERTHILQQLVAHACQATGNKIVKELRQQRTVLTGMLITHWQKSMPGITRDQQMALLQNSCANSLTFGPSVVGLKPDGKALNEGEFGRVMWRNDGMSDARKGHLASLASAIMDVLSGASGILADGVSTSWSSSFYVPGSFPDIIRGFQPTSLYRGEGNQEMRAHNDMLLRMHDQIVIQLGNMKDLLFSADEMYENLAAAIAPLKTAQALAEAMPEAVKHFPASLTYIKPAKEVADPKYINEIRAKLKKGLPV